MANEYLSNIKIADLTLTINPDSYSQQFTKYGSFKRTIGGGIVDVDVNGKRLVIEVKSVTQSQVEDIKRRTVLNKVIDFIDYVPIAEKGSRTREVFEDLGSETVDSELIYLYIPTYKIMIFDYVQVYAGNKVTYTISGEEI